MSSYSNIPKSFKRAASQVVPMADIYKNAEVPTGSSFQPLDKLVDSIGSQMQIARSDDFWQDVNSKFKPMSDNIRDAVLSINGMLDMNPEELKRELSDQFGNANFLNKLTNGQLSKLTDYMNVGTLQLAYKDGVAIIDDLKGNMSASGIMEAARKLLGNVGGLEFINNSAIFGLANLVLDELESSGLTDLFDEIMNQVEDGQTRIELIKQRAKSAAGESDIKLCRHYIDRLSESEARSIKDDILPLIVSSYALKGDDDRSYRSRANEIVDLMNKIDKDWATEGGLLSTRYFHPMSGDCIKVFSQLDNFYAPMAIACNQLQSDMDASDVSSSTLGVDFME